MVDGANFVSLANSPLLNPPGFREKALRTLSPRSSATTNCRSCKSHPTDRTKHNFRTAEGCFSISYCHKARHLGNKAAVTSTTREPRMGEAYICDYVRTPIGRFGGVLSSIRADDLGARPLKALIERNPGVDWE